mgnify:CR=1 FL=1
MTETKLSVKFKRLHPEAIMPRYQTDGAKKADSVRLVRSR